MRNLGTSFRLDMGAALFVVALAIVVPGCPQAEPRPTPTPTVMPTVSATPSTTMTPTPTPSPGAVAICTLGDSLTEGDGDDLGRGGYPQRLIEMIQAVRPGSNITNLGRSGWTSDDTVVGGPLEQAIAAQPTIACVLIGSNDLWALYEHGPAAGTGDSEEAEDLSNYTANIDAILRGLGDVGVIVFIGLVDDQSLRPVALNDEMRADVYPNITPDELERMSLQAQRYNEVIRTKAVELGATTVDFYNTTIFTEPATLSEDGNHPNAAGYDAMAQNWFNAIASFLG